MVVVFLGNLMNVVVGGVYGVLIVGVGINIRYLGGLLVGSGGSSSSLVGSLFSVGGGFFVGNDVDEEVKYVGFGKGGGNIGVLEGVVFVFFSMNLGMYGEFSDEDVVIFGEENGGFG